MSAPLCIGGRELRSRFFLGTGKFSDPAVMEAAIRASVQRMVAAVAGYVPGYRLKQDVQFETVDAAASAAILREPSAKAGLKVSVFLEVEGAGHYLPAYAGNLDIMTSAALKTAEKIAERMAA